MLLDWSEVCFDVRLENGERETVRLQLKTKCAVILAKYSWQKKSVVNNVTQLTQKSRLN